jgi:hypothetical protein
MDGWEIAFLLVSAAVIIGLLLFFAQMDIGGAGLPLADTREWQWPTSPVGSLGCMGFVAGKGALLNQSSRDADGNWTLPLPPKNYTYKDVKGATRTASFVPQVGLPQHFEWVKDESGNWVQTGKLEPYQPGTAKDCCALLRASGSRGAAVYEPQEHACYIFPYGETDSNGDFHNIFPLFGEQALEDTATLPEPGAGSYTYMIACGGEGQPPCDYHTNAAPASHKDWLPSQAGCSQRGRERPRGKGVGTIQLRHTKREGSPFGAPYMQCQTLPFIERYGFKPDDKDHPEASWSYPKSFPYIDPNPSGLYDPNWGPTSMARFRIDALVL